MKKAVKYQTKKRCHSDKTKYTKTKIFIEALQYISQITYDAVDIYTLFNEVLDENYEKIDWSDPRIGFYISNNASYFNSLQDKKQLLQDKIQKYLSDK
ncbi:MAG: hypothetical protein LBK06_07115 [Planctomycetaceae bacterium]|jgi:hypothetical protein|nr:hypothetical protein [Planctomycetaceae bacterium]